jgi:peptide/nickel transport system ATP-binding protein
MQSGRIVEAAENKQIFSHAQHQYTQTLLDALPDINYSAEHEKLAAPEILKLTGFKVHYPIRQGLFQPYSIPGQDHD